MILRLIKDYFKCDYQFETLLIHKIKKKTRKCYIRFIYLFYRFFIYRITALIIYPIWYIFKSHIAYKLYHNFPMYNHKEKFGYYSYDRFNDWLNTQIYYSINTKQLKRDIKNALSIIEYQLWLYGDISNIEIDGEIPAHYKSHIKNMFVRRWLYSSVRNPKFNSYTNKNGIRYKNSTNNKKL